MRRFGGVKTAAPLRRAAKRRYLAAAVVWIVLSWNDFASAAQIRVPYDQPTIQAAINATTHGDTIVVYPGTYSENIHFGDKNVVLRSTNPTSPSVVARTIIDGHQAGSVVTFSGGEGRTAPCILSGFTIINGRADNGGGIYGHGTCATIEYNVISYNTATMYEGTGAGLYSCDGIIQNNTISNNWAVSNGPPWGGGLAYCGGLIQNNLIFSNTAVNNDVGWGDGGGLYSCGGTIVNNTIVGNSANFGGGLSSCPGTIRNNIIWGNSGSEPQMKDSSTPSYSCIQGWSGGETTNIALDPQFVDPAHGDYHLRGISPCIDAGGTVTLTRDFEGDPRPFDWPHFARGDGSNLDIGADEAVPTTSPTLFVAPAVLRNSCPVGSDAPTQTLQIWNAGTGTLAYTVQTTAPWLAIVPPVGSSSGPTNRTTHQIVCRTSSLGLGNYRATIVTSGAAVNNPVSIRVSVAVGGESAITVGKAGDYDYSVIQNAIGAATSGDLIVVYPATYPENIHFNGKAITLRSTAPTSPSVVARTIIQGQGGPVVTFAGTESASCILSGFTITGGQSDAGAGIRGYGTHATIRYNVITGNSAWDPSFARGGGLYDCDGLIEYNTIARNSVSAHGELPWEGGAVSGGGLRGCDGTIRYNAITSNSLSTPGEGNASGGGLYACNGTIEDNLISGNGSGGGNDGGASGLGNCNGTIQRNVISRNSTSSGGNGGGGSGALVGCNGTIQNNIITGNSYLSLYRWSLLGCSGAILNNTIFGDDGAMVACHGTIRNNILWQTSGLEECSLPSYCCIQGWTGGGTGNIAADPRLVNPSGGDFHLRFDSPCIDAGGSVTLTQDFEGDPRPFDCVLPPRGDGSHFDIGADEFILSAAYLAASVSSLNVWTAPGTDAATKTLTVWNAGSGSLTYTVGTAAGWLSASPTSAVSYGPASRTAHSITFHTAGLAVGNYAATVTLTATGVFNSPMVIPVSLLVKTPPRCAITQPSTGTICVAGDWTTVAWTCVNNPDSDRFYLSISKDGRPVSNWSSVACHDGQNQFQGRLPFGLPRATGYRLRLHWLVNNAVYYESGPIVITDSLPFLGVPFRQYRLYR
jgi:hypothetical protein